MWKFQTDESGYVSVSGYSRVYLTKHIEGKDTVESKS